MSVNNNSDFVLSQDNLILWEHQKNAIKKMEEYYSSYLKGKTVGSGLVHMPTGSGKSRVIISISRYNSKIDCVLVLTPRISLRRQLVEKLNNNEIIQKKYMKQDLPKEVYEWEKKFPLRSEYDKNSTVIIKNAIIVTTIQMLHSRKQNEKGLYEFLKENISLIIIDEGHYEPAPFWSETIRGLNKPKILFTATPYRNDYKSFDIDQNFRFSYTYKEASGRNYLRSVHVEQLPFTKDPNQIVKDIKNYYEKFFNITITNSPKKNIPRIIIRCDKKSSINQIITALKNHSINSYYAIHERFDDDSGSNKKMQTVPRMGAELSPLIWIHQYKLLEGIDDPRFQFLAFFGPLNTNTRSFIQQVGRIIRNPKRKQNNNAYVLDHTGGKQKEIWESFIEYDKNIYNEDHKLESISEGFVTEYFDLHPEYSYLDGKFRNKFNLANQDPSQEILFPLSVNIINKNNNFDTKDFCSFIEHQFNSNDIIFKKYTKDDSIIYTYLKYSNSRFLKNQYLIECSHNIMFLREFEKYLSFYDSDGYVPKNMYKLGLEKPISSDILKKLFKDAKGSRLTSAFFRNSYLQYNAAKSRYFSANDIDKTVPFLDDHSHVVTRVTGYSEEDLESPEAYKKKEKLEISQEEESEEENKKNQIRRYVGFTNGKITQSNKLFEFKDYVDWVSNVMTIVEGNIKSINTFERWAKKVTNIKDPSPQNILLDLFDVENDFKTIKSNDNLKIDSCCLNIKKQDQVKSKKESTKNNSNLYFKVNANGDDCKVYIKYDPDKKMYKLDSDDLDGVYYSVEESGYDSLIEYLNKEQSFRIIPNTEGIAYVHGEFYNMTQKFGKEFDPKTSQIVNILYEKEKLEGISSEYGENEMFNKDTLFGLVKNLGENHGMKKEFGNPDILVCDHGNKEIADFIMVNKTNTPEKVIFIHAKANSKRAPYSATKLSKVCPQAIKNIKYISMFEDIETPAGVKDWNKPIQELDSRIIRPKTFSNRPEKLWGEIKTIIRKPNTIREVWLLLGNIWSKSEIINRLSKDQPTKEAVQGAILLKGTIAAVGSQKANLRVFCMP